MLLTALLSLAPVPQKITATRQPLPCVSSIEDAAVPGSCVSASSQPQLGMLYPLSSTLFVTPTGRVGVGTTSPNATLGVQGELAVGLFQNVTGSYASVAGGSLNGATGDHAFVGGGFQNGASGDGAAVGGGRQNTASGYRSVVAGGLNNDATGDQAMVPGGYGCTAAGTSSLAAGTFAEALHEGSFVWNGNALGTSVFSSTADHQFLVWAGGGIGLNTPTPRAPLHLTGSSTPLTPASAVHRETAVIDDADAHLGLFSNDGAPYGSAVVLGEISVGLVDKWAMVREATGWGSDLRFTYGPNADISLNTTQMVIETEGQLGVGVTDPNARLHLDSGPGETALRVQVDGTTRVIVASNGAMAIGKSFTPSYDLQLHSEGTFGGTAGKPGGGSWSVSSDERLKKGVRELEGSLDRLLELRGVTYEYRDPEPIGELPGRHTGMIAQEVERVFPEWVHEGPDGYKRVSVTGFEAEVVEALREMRAEIDALRAELAACGAH